MTKTTVSKNTGNFHSDVEASQRAGDAAHLDVPAWEMLDLLGVPSFFIDRDGSFRVGNRAFYTLLGGNADTYLGRGIYNLLIRDDANEFCAEDRRLLEVGGSVSRPAEIFLASGESRRVVLKKTVVPDTPQGMGGILVAMADLSELAEVKDALHVSESEKHAILEGFPGIVCLFDINEKVVWANDRVRDLHPNPVGKTCHQIFCQKEQSCNSCAVPASLETGNVQSTIRQFEMCTSTGEERVYELTSTPVKDSSGKVTSAVVIGRDVTETTNLERQLRHSQKMEAIGTLAGGIAHDFNNVLTPIMGYSEILRFKLMQSGEADKANLEFVEGILKAAKRAKKLVEQILTFSRSSEQKASLQYIHPIVKEVMKLMRVTLPSTITIKEQIDEQCGIVSVDPVQIHQILINLCTNSAHAMAGGHGTLSVTLASGGKDQDGQEWLRLSIADTGCGIQPELLDRIFEPYFTTKEKSHGTGMGLAMVHGIISRQGGRIEVSSEVGVGTTFDVYLPVTVAPTRIDQVVSTSDLQRGSGRILLVDDEAQVVQVTGELLTSLGYEVTGRTSPVAALSLVAENPEGYDLVLTDLTMPELTGVELSRKIRNVRKDLPVVLFTGYSDSVSREDAEEAGIKQYCMKPVSLRELSKVIYTTLHMKG
ncbi:hybrid sensor histidine kinase/response regulator [Desulfopila aestuarii]|uniref:histidine kinase n=1 Tax=Desulfopila aestuarii DSM 18488 TaxID=1121416 RepID=A0A1M7XZ32_9BACT|nr:PAS domain-containing sensor histidine kinase [Desulfopila aestuarii]SHO44384.1 Signal transduction histidine kinase [Desulfopila aestuarii DSM 18488]